MSYSAEVLADSPVGYWRMSETSGAVIANSVAGAPDFTLTGTYARNSGSLSELTPATTFSGGGYATLTSADYNFAEGAPFSVELWTRPTATISGYRALLARYDTTTLGRRGYQVWAYQDGQVGFELWGTSTTVHAALAFSGPIRTLNTAEWTHIVGTFDGTYARLYVNGILAAVSAPANDTIKVRPDDPLRLGAGTASYTGVLDEVALYDTALPADRIAKHFLAGRRAAPLSYPEVVRSQSVSIYHRLGESSGTSAASAVGGAAATYVGTVGFGASGVVAGDVDTAIGVSGGASVVTGLPASGLTSGTPCYADGWFRPSTTPTNAFVMGWADAEGRGLAVVRDGSGRFQARWFNGSTLFTTSNTIVSANDQWHHIALNFTGSSVFLLVNGVAAGGFSAPVISTMVSTTPLAYGAGPTFPSFVGFIDEISGAIGPVLATGQALARVRTASGTSDRYMNAVLADGPARFYRLDETTGTTATDSAPLASNATYTGTYTLDRSPLIRSGRAVRFTGSGKGTAQGTTVSTGTSNITLDCWVTIDGPTNGAFIRNGALNGLSLGIGNGSAGSPFDSAGYRVMGLFENVRYVNSGYDLPGPGTYHLAMVVGTSGLVLFYVNGIYVGGTASGTTPAAASGGNLNVGGYAVTAGGTTYNRFPTATVDEAAIYASPLSADRIAARYLIGTLAYGVMHEPAASAAVSSAVDLRPARQVSASARPVATVGTDVRPIREVAVTGRVRPAVTGRAVSWMPIAWSASMPIEPGDQTRARAGRAQLPAIDLGRKADQGTSRTRL